MKAVAALLAMSFVLLLTGGCNSKPQGGVVGFSESLAIGHKVPDIPVLGPHGRQWTLQQLHRRIRLVAFVESGSEICCRLDTRLTAIAPRFRARNITIVQISMPTDGCPHGNSCLELCSMEHPSLVTLCDPQRIAWRAYGKPTINTVYLIDYHDRVVFIDTLSDLDRISEQAVETDDYYDFFMDSYSD